MGWSETETGGVGVLEAGVRVGEMGGAGREEGGEGSLKRQRNRKGPE